MMMVETGSVVNVSVFMLVKHVEEICVMVLNAKMVEPVWLRRLKEYECRVANVLIILKVRNVKISFVKAVFRALIMEHVLMMHVNAVKRTERQSIMAKIVKWKVKKHVH